MRSTSCHLGSLSIGPVLIRDLLYFNCSYTFIVDMTVTTKNGSAPEHRFPVNVYFGEGPVEGLQDCSFPGPPTTAREGIRSSIEGSGGKGMCGSA